MEKLSDYVKKARWVYCMKILELNPFKEAEFCFIDNGESWKPFEKQSNLT